MKANWRMIFVGWALGSGLALAELKQGDSFDYVVGDLTPQEGGSGWIGGWADSGNPVVVREEGLSYVDAAGNQLEVSGGCLDTQDGGTATTISYRLLSAESGERWISMLVQPVGNFSDFIGVSFYSGGLATGNARFAIETSGKDLRLTRRAGTPSPLHTTSYSTTIGEPVLVVLHLIPGAGESTSLPDRINVYFQPRLDVVPTVAHASVSLQGLSFDRVRIAGQSGKSILVDELRIGTTYGSVTPYIPAPDPDVDGDGLTLSQELLLGTDPEVSDLRLIEALRANAGWLQLHHPSQIMDLRIRGGAIGPPVNQQAVYRFSWLNLQGHVVGEEEETVDFEGGSKFLRLKAGHP